MIIIIFSLTTLLLLAIFDLLVGVSNDAVNFLNSAIGSKVSSRRTITVVASLGILAGVTFSSGMMEIARKGIFNPSLFNLSDVLIIFVAVMLIDVILLDLFNTFGLPTSTTVSMIFELLGASVAVSILKMSLAGESIASLGEYINTAKVLAIFSSILLSVAIAFTFGALFQFISRMIFTFDYAKRLKRYGGIWGGASIAIITYFIFIKGIKGASFLAKEHVDLITSNSLVIMAILFAVSAFIFQILILFTKVNVLRVIVLAGTFALAMAFAANDLVNFIGVPLAGFSGYFSVMNSPDPMNALMVALKEPVKTNTLILLSAGALMTATLWFSKKARTVTYTEVSLSRQEEGTEQFESIFLARIIVRLGIGILEGLKKIMPDALIHVISRRKDISHFQPEPAKDGEMPAFDLIRAAVNMMVASALISFAISLKLPLSTTYVTFMVAMGTSLADGAWDRESAVYRVSGVLTVIAGWFLTGIIAFTLTFACALFLYFLRTPALIILIAIAAFIIWKSHKTHAAVEEKRKTGEEVYNLRKIKDPVLAVGTSFEQTGKLLEQVSLSIARSFNGLMRYDRVQLRISRDESKKIQEWTNIIIANIFKTLRLIHKMDIKSAQRYAQTITNLQEIAESQRDVALRSYHHVMNHHKGLLPEQKNELEKVVKSVTELLDITAESLKHDKIADMAAVKVKADRLTKLISECDKNQIIRIQNERSKTRLSILFYAYLVSASKISSSTKSFLEIFHESLQRKGITKML